MTKFALAVFFISSYATYAFVVAGRKWVATGTTALLLLQLPFFVGVIQHIDLSRSIDVHYGLFLALGVWAVVIGAAIANLVSGFKPRTEWRRAIRHKIPFDSPHQVGRKTLMAIAVISVIVGVLFVARIGYNTFLAAVSGIGSEYGEQNVSFRDLRAESTRRSYVAAGYAAQFIAILLPAAVLMMVVRARQLRSGRLLVRAAVLAAVATFFMTATGGRQYLLQFGAAYAIVSFRSLSLLPNALHPSIRMRMAIVPLIIVVFAATTILQGRITEVERPLTIIGSLYNRLGGDYSQYQLESIELIDVDGTQWGRQWLQDLSIVLPGPTKGLTLNTRLHEQLFGSPDGNAPLNIWGSVYHNWGMVAGVILLGVWGFVLQRASVVLLYRRRTVVALILGHLICLRLGFVRDPYSLFLEGVLTLLVVRFLLLPRRGSLGAVSVPDESKIHSTRFET